MSYIGNTPEQQGFSPAIDYFSGTGSQTAFTCSRPIASNAQVQVVVNNVSQNPSTAFTVSGNTITFTGAPSSGTNNIYVYYTSPITQVNALTQGPSVIGPMYVSINGATTLGGATNPIMGMSGSANSYVQSYVLNQTNGANSSADFTAYPSNGTDAAGWVDMGITSPSFSQAAFSVTGPNEAYLFGSAPSGSGKTGNLVIATDSTGTANSIQFYTNGFNQSKSAAVFTLDKNGNAALGATPSTWTAFKAIEVGANGAGIAGGTGQPVMFCNATYNSGWKYTASNYACNYDQLNGIHRWFYAPSGTAGNAITFAEAMRIDTSGNLIVGGTGASGKLDVQTSGNSVGVMSQNSNTATAGSYLYWGYASATKFIVYGHGGIANYQANNVNLSDRSEKTDFSPAGSYLEKICAIPVQTFKYIDQQDDELNLGVVAQDVQAVAPELVTESNWGTPDEPKMRLAIYQTDLQYALMKCIQEQQALITTLTERITALEAK